MVKNSLEVKSKDNLQGMLPECVLRLCQPGGSRASAIFAYLCSSSISRKGKNYCPSDNLNILTEMSIGTASEVI